MFDRTAVCTKVFDATGHVMERSKGKRGAELSKMWNEAVRLIWHAAETLDDVVDTTYESFVHSLHSYLASDQASSAEECKETGNIYIDEDNDVVVVPVASFLSRQGVINPNLKNGPLVGKCASRYAKELGVAKGEFKKRWYDKVQFTCYVIPRGDVQAVMDRVI